MRVFVKNMRGEPLMPCKPRKARLLLKQNKARVIGYKPFTIQLTIATGETVQRVGIGIDSGAKYQGVAVVSEDKVLMKGEIELRSDVSSVLKTRSDFRRGRRTRNLRHRKPKFKYKTIRSYDSKKRKWIKRKMSFVSPRPKGWLPPSLQSRMDNIFHWYDKYLSLLPKPKLHIEVGKFDVQKMINPNIKGVDYQQGQTYGYHDVRYFVFARDNYTCQVCRKSKDKVFNTHHIYYRDFGGSNRADNLITVCTDCHTAENHKKGKIFWRWMIENKQVNAFRETPFMNVMRKHVFSRYPNARITYGSVTTPHRKALRLSKTHANDAIAITGIEVVEQLPEKEFKIKQFRKKKRSLHEATARKGRKAKNITQKRNNKNTKELRGFYLNDYVITAFGENGYIAGFTGSSGCYIKTIEDEYIKLPEKSYKQVPLSQVKLINHNNNWQYQIM